MPRRAKSEVKYGSASPATTRRRCAIYTRKSSEEGLDQEFNSLDAQREACAAYVASQRHEGWVLLPTFYDDGGISGGTLDRPALKQLLADIAAGKVDLVVVYKVDRLTRSLAAFVKIVDVFDASGASFVSVTQQFNTATSMGRLTLNMLLSFAQFEREVTGERIRDKIAASKRKGMWMGGIVPLGYDVIDRKLLVNEAEADRVRSIYRLYLELGSVRELQLRLAEAGVCSKFRGTAEGRMRGGTTLARGALYLILRNRIYRGEITHQGKTYAGEHEAIVEADLFEAVQQMLASHRVERQDGTQTKAPSLLAGLIFDGDGQPMLPTHAVKAGRRYRYYVSKSLQIGAVESLVQAGLVALPSAARTLPTQHTSSRFSAALRVPAHEVEQLVIAQVQALLDDRAALLPMIQAMTEDGMEQKCLLDRATTLAQEWRDLSGAHRRGTMRQLLDRVCVSRQQLALHIRPSRLMAVLDPARALLDQPPHEAATILRQPVTLQRTGLEMRLLVEGSGRQREPDTTLIKLILKAIDLRDKLIIGGMSVTDLAEQEGITPSYMTRILRIAFLAPSIIAAILDGRQPLGLTAQKLTRDTRLPMNWAQQAKQLGFA